LFSAATECVLHLIPLHIYSDTKRNLFAIFSCGTVV
jgi:hypothetical protein